MSLSGHLAPSLLLASQVGSQHHRVLYRKPKYSEGFTIPLGRIKFELLALIISCTGPESVSAISKSIYLFIYFVIRPRAGDNTIGL